ncbi:LysR family transcriptional regulator [Hydrogenophaga sp. 2FB]|uniref:LysR family transcriptional regulator n=1 Tax=Hydrogenophaga sp. 2FB TaxID=2502187 RepID=UPI00148509F1|nr:LysR family transcriptional regulator [Hydrogenophaga sp. 2FB]
MIEKLSPRNLRVLIAVQERTSVASAANALLRAPSAISRSVQELELALGTPLFDRLPAGMLPTPAGELAYRRAKLVESEFLAAHRALTELGAARQAPLFAMLASVRQMAVLVKLAELGHMPSVAEALGVSQPAISSALREVEQSLKLPLFDRGLRRMVATPAGELLVFRLRRVLSEIGHLRADVGSLLGDVSGRVTMSMLPSSRTWLMPQAIANVVGRHPGVQVSVVDAPFDVLFAGLQSGEIDFIYTGIGPEYRHRDLRVEPVSQDRLVVVARAGHPLARKAKLKASDLSRFPWVLRDPSAPSRQLLDHVFRRIGLDSPRVAVQAGDLGLLRGLLMQSDMLTAVSPQHLLHELQAGTLAALDIDLPDSVREVGFVLRKDAQPSAPCVLLMEEILGAEKRRLSPVRPGRARASRP